ncbi:MAG TPA: ferritin-like domain-containing protein, partial [Candidatus Udaeobacter sp.]|nr:ferritin-like domain-containing protein [Candidatus Udaeobacter sp.]
YSTSNSSENNSEKKIKHRRRSISRRSFLGTSFALGAGTLGAGLLPSVRTAEGSGGLTPGDAALLRFPAALEILEADFWIQYNELGGVQDAEVPGGSGNPDYTEALEVLDEDMAVYIHDNTDDEITHHTFLNAYLMSKGAAPANLDPFRTLMGSTATGVNPALIGHRLTNLTQLTIDTSWWTRYRDDSHNPDLDPDHVFPQAVPTLGVNQHTAIPRTDADTTDPNFLQAIANTAAFHFPTIEQGGNSLYPSLAQRATHEETVRILISIGPTETMHFQTWSDKAGNAPPLTAVDPMTGVSVTFPDLEVDDELFNKSLIMPEPCPFLDRSLPIVSIIRPTKTQGAAMGALRFLTDMGLFIGQSPAFFAYMAGLARDADHAHHGGRR